MSLKSKNVISNFTGISVTIKDQQKFDKLDSLLASIQLPPYTLLSELTALINSNLLTCPGRNALEDTIADTSFDFG